MAPLTLPQADWRHRDGLASLGAAIGTDRGLSRYVGGVVRDTLLGGAVNDIDIATSLDPQAVLNRLKAARIKAIPTGLAHGTITAVLPSGVVEVTTLRRDIATDGRHAVIAYTDDWREDAARRDFTINALYADPVSGTVYDYFGGIDDLAARRVRFIGDPLQRIAEDHLRILRFFRFLARFGDTPDGDALAACAARANDLMALSRERIADELLRLLVAPGAPAIVALMHDNGILAPVIPEIDATGIVRLATVAAREATTGTGPDPIRRLAALLTGDPALGDQIGARLKLSNAQRKRLIVALDATPVGRPHALAYRLGTLGAIDRLLLQPAEMDVRQSIDAVAGWTPPRLPVTGGELVARGIAKGPVVARTLRAIEAQWLAEDFPGGERLAEIADAAVAQALRSTSSA